MIAWLAMAACVSPDPGVDPVLDGIVVAGPAVPRVSRPLTGGALAVDGDRLVAADLDGDRVALLDLASGARRDVTFPDGYAPGPVALSGDDAIVALPGPGAAARIGFTSGAVAVEPVCAEPRGVDAAFGLAVVVCADGTLAVLGGARFAVEPGLRDVVVVDPETALVAVQRSAEVLRVSLADGAILARNPLPVLPDPEGHPFAARAVRRMVRVGDGRVAVLYQAHATDVVPLDLAAGPPYGSGACSSVARPLVTWLDALGTPVDTVRLDAVLPVDLGFWPEGDGAFVEPTPLVAAALAGPVRGVQAAYPASALADPSVYCVPRGVLIGAEGWPTGVASGPDGPLAVTRAPFAILSADGALAAPDPDDAADPGFALFHEAAPAGVACATCHVDGRDDAHTWQFEPGGPRRTQSLAGGLRATAPYHWDGGLVDLAALFAETGVGRMGLAPRAPAEIDALLDWLDALPSPAPPATTADPAADADAAALFAEACAECHAPVRPDSVDVGTGGSFQAPSLAGVGARLPLMHDGCATTLRERFDPACGGAAHGPPLTEPEIDLLVAWLLAR